MATVSLGSSLDQAAIERLATELSKDVAKQTAISDDYAFRLVAAVLAALASEAVVGPALRLEGPEGTLGRITRTVAARHPGNLVLAFVPGEGEDDGGEDGRGGARAAL